MFKCKFICINISFESFFIIELLPVPYFHVVFTLPDAINALAIHAPKMVYEILFDAA
ncbi:MAG: hypothetical protein FGM41_10565 [Bacteroidetes bacterium]|nr:hypothetical protein [Bacteroidota bacterium]